jgi:hypothetical protein
VTAVLGEFLGPAGEHIAAAVCFRGELPYHAQCGVVRQVDRLLATLSRYLGDLPLPDPFYPARDPQRSAASRAAPARLALGRAARSLRPVIAGAADADTGDAHPVVGHLAAAAGYLAAGRDLLQTHFADGPAGPQAPRSYWAPVIASGPVTAALLGEIADDTQHLASWIGRLPVRWRMSPSMPTSPLLVLRQAEPWLQLAVTAIHTARCEHHPAPASGLLYAIPVNAPPPRPLSATDEAVADLCARIPVTAERLRHATLHYATRAYRSPPPTSLSWRRDALACAIADHASELILRTLAERAGHASLEPPFAARLHTVADYMAQAWKAWRSVTGQWDIVTTGAPRGTGLTTVAAEIGDLALEAGRLAYRNPDWTPACSDAAVVRDPADLAQSPGGVIAVLAAVHQAADAVSRVAATDQEAVITAAADNRLYVPVRLLSDKYDIPHPYTLAPPTYTQALLTAYDTTVQTASSVTTALDDLAAAIGAPSSLLAATRQARAPAWPQPRQLHDQEQAPQPPLVGAAPGRTEQALRELQIRDPALLLRAAVIDQAARDLVSEAKARADSRSTVTVRTSLLTPVARQIPGLPARTARQDAPRAPQRLRADQAAATTTTPSAASGQNREARAASVSPHSVRASRPPST